MAKVTMYSTVVCPFCTRAEMLLKQPAATEIEKVFIDRDPEQRALMMERTGQRTVPQIFINDQFIGGFDQLYALDREGKLDQLLA